MITRNLIERAIDMMPIASTDQTRHNISGVYIHVEERREGTLALTPKVTLTATNGHMLLTREYFEEKCPLGKYMLRKEDVAALKLVLKESVGVSEIECSIDSHRDLFIGNATKVRIFRMNFEYPDYQQVIPVHNERVAIAFNAQYLLDLAKALVGENKKAKPNIRIIFDPSEPSKAILVEKEGDAYSTAVVMPVRLSGTQAIVDEYTDRINKLTSDRAS